MIPVSKIARVVSRSTYAGDGRCMECLSSVGYFAATIYRLSEYVEKIRPSVALPTGTAIGLAKNISDLSAPQALGTFHCYATKSALTQELLYFTSNPLHTDSLGYRDV